MSLFSYGVAMSNDNEFHYDHLITLRNLGIVPFSYPGAYMLRAAILSLLVGLFWGHAHALLQSMLMAEGAHLLTLYAVLPSATELFLFPAFIAVIAVFVAAFFQISFRMRFRASAVSGDFRDSSRWQRFFLTSLWLLCVIGFCVLVVFPFPFSYLKIDYVSSPNLWKGTSVLFFILSGTLSLCSVVLHASTWLRFYFRYRGRAEEFEKMI